MVIILCYLSVVLHFHHITVNTMGLKEITGRDDGESVTRKDVDLNKGEYS
jgi:hypothetical protein